MNTPSLAERQQQFLNNELWEVVVHAALASRNSSFPTYHKNASTTDQKAAFRKFAKGRFQAMVQEEYKDTVSSPQHVRNLETLQKEITGAFSGILQNGKIRLGIMQKWFNLYLKYQWCTGCIPAPPHCPFDRIILEEKLQLKTPTPWTAMDSPKEYAKWVEAAEAQANAEGYNNIAEWELWVYARRMDAVT